MLVDSRWVGALVACAVGACSTSSSTGAAPEAGQADTEHTGATADLSTIMAQYKSWQPQASAPENISSYIFALCRAPTLNENAFSMSEHGKERFLLDWANPAAVDGLQKKGATPFAVGSAIVKEKLVQGADGGFQVVALGIMSKREAGFDSTRGDWDYGYWESGPGLLRSPEQSAHCGGCHAGAVDTDFVFVDKSWLSK